MEKRERGHPKNFNNPKEILDLWEQYKSFINDNPDVQQVSGPKGVVEIRVKKPLTRQGFFVFVHQHTGKSIHQYIDNDGGNYNDFLEVCTRIRREWEDDQITGTLTGRYKAPNLVARLNGITEKIDNKTEVSGEINISFVEK